MREAAMKTALAVAAAIFLASMIFTAPAARAQADPAANDPAFADPALVEAAAVPLQTIAPADVLKMMNDKRSDVVLVDTQPAGGFADAHIPGAVNYSWVMRIKTFPIALPRNKTLVFYGSCPNDTTDIVRQLAEFGYFNVKIMDGGIEKWMQLKFPTAGASGNQQPSPAVSQLTSKPAQNASAAAH
jgi:rhodanese-related sulfurtransferase